MARLTILPEPPLSIRHLGNFVFNIPVSCAAESPQFDCNINGILDPNHTLNALLVQRLLPFLPRRSPRQIPLPSPSMAQYRPTAAMAS
jgi:hypothetical protein